MMRRYYCRAMDPLRGSFGEYIDAASRADAAARFFLIFALRPHFVEVDK